MVRPNIQDVLQNLKNDTSNLPITEPPLKELKGINFGLLGPEEIKDMAVCKITKSKIAAPYKDTVYDERMGPSDINGICSTCNENVRKCPGHFGYIDLECKVIHPQFTRYCMSILNSFCLECSKLKISEEELNLELNPNIIRNRRMKEVEEICSKIEYCKYCNEPCPLSIKFENNKFYKIYNVDKNMEIKSMITIEEMSVIFENIATEDLITMGFDIKFRTCKKHNLVEEVIPSFRPEYMIISRLPVLPTVSRPSNFEKGIKSDDDLTSSYIEIVKNNQKLLNPLKEKTRNDTILILEGYLRSFIDNTDESTKHTSGKPIKSIKERISGKGGHVRGKIFGKRVDNSSRTVISPNTSLEPNELGVPKIVAENLTFPETVTPINIEKMKKYLEEGKIKDHERNGEIKNISKMKKKFRDKLRLKFGDIVYRCMENGDNIVFNRQPTLHRGSMMSHKVKIMESGKTFCLNLSVTSPYNADFDGDEMQIHFPQNYKASNEIEQLLGVNNMLLSTQSNKPLMGIVQDTTLGSFLLTDTTEEVILTKAQFMDILFCTGENYYKKIKDLITKCNKFGIKKWSGKMLFSSLLPTDFHYNNGVIIKNGILVDGTITSKQIGKAKDSIIHKLVIEYSHERAAEFIRDIQYLIGKFLQIHGFSVGLKDFIIDEKNNEEIQENIQKAYLEVENIQNTETDPLIKEFKINAALTNRGQSAVINGLCKNNRLKVMIDSGSKGNQMNFIQIAGNLGQNNVQGKRIIPKIDNGKRTLFCFDRNDTRPITRGYIENCFLKGLRVHEFFFHTMAGREGVYNTAIGTAETGYTQRKLVKRCEDMVVEYDFTVRNNAGHIIQFQYGNDNMDPRYTLPSKDNPSFIDIDNLVEKLNN